VSKLAGGVQLAKDPRPVPRLYPQMASPAPALEGGKIASKCVPLSNLSKCGLVIILDSTGQRPSAH